MTTQNKKKGLGFDVPILDNLVSQVQEIINPEVAKGRAGEGQRQQNQANTQTQQSASPSPTPPTALELQKEKERQANENNTPLAIRDNTGRITGVRIGEKIYNGIPKAQVNALMEHFAQTTGLTNGVQDTEQQATAQNQSGQAMQAITEQGAVNPSVQLDSPLSPSNIGANAIAGAPSLATGIISGATSGAGIGALAGAPTGIGAPILATVLGIIGGIVGGGVALYRKIAQDQKQATTEAYSTFSDYSSTRRQKQLLNMANQRTDAPADIIHLYELNLANIRESQRALRNLTKNKVGAQLSQAMDELNTVNAWLENEPNQRRQLYQSLMNPNSQLIYPVDDTPTQ